MLLQEGLDFLIGDDVIILCLLHGENLPGTGSTLRKAFLQSIPEPFQTLLMKGHVGDFKAIFRARHAFKRWRHEFDEDRKKIQESRTDHHSMPERKPYAILWHYYAKGRKFYSQL